MFRLHAVAEWMAPPEIDLPIFTFDYKEAILVLFVYHKSTCTHARLVLAMAPPAVVPDPSETNFL
jgi:hypothetical protein